jgi:recombination protein RecA
MSQALRKLTAIVSRSKTCFIFVNQIREKIGFFLGSPETTTGGRALKFYSSLRVDIRRIATLKEGDKVIGNRVKVKIVKNKMAPPFRLAQFDIIYGEGISKEGDLVDWYSYKGERIGQGRESVKRLLQENEELAADLDTEIRKAVGLIPSEETAEKAAEKPSGKVVEEAAVKETGQAAGIAVEKAVQKPAEKPAVK